MQYNIPILIIAFNRPDISKQTFEVIRRLKPAYLYVAIDGARDNVEKEREKVNEVASMYHDVDWKCSAHYRHNERNMGAEITVSSAVSWVLTEHEFCIVLEDDILATDAFFDYARQMLERYRDNDKVYLISAAQFTPMDSMKTDYVFSLYGHTGFGWGTWRRAWQHFSMDLSDFDKTIADKTIAQNFSCHQAYIDFLKSVKKMKSKGSKNCSWDSCWSYVRIRDGGLSIVPRCNLTQNVGVFGLHANGFSNYHRLEGNQDFIVVHHPSSIKVDVMYDGYHYRNYLHHSLFSLIINKIKSVL